MNETPQEAPDCKVITASYDRYQDWTMDPSGWYVLIRIHENKLEVGLCKKANIIEVKIVGDTAEELYNTIIREQLITMPEHCAYLGKELEKAEIAMKLNKEYIQDDPLAL